MEKVTDCKSSEGSSPDRENDIEATLRTGIVGSSSWSYLKSHFVGMGFSAAMVDKAIEENGEEDANLLLETLLTYSVLEKFNSKFPDGGFSPIKEEFLSTGATSNNDWEIEGPDTSANDHIGTKTSLLMMKFSEEEVDLAINTLGTEVPIRELADLIIANQIGAQTSKEVALESSQDRLLANKTLEDALVDLKMRMLGIASPIALL